MESIDIFFRIFHEDLNPLTNQKTKEYFQNQLTEQNNEENSSEYIEELSYKELKFFYYKALLSDSKKRIKRELHEKVFLSNCNGVEIQEIVRKHQALLLNYCRIIDDTYFSFEKDLLKFQISEEKDDIDIFKLVYDALDNTLDYLEQIFYKYLDHSLSVSYQQKLWFVLKNKKLALCKYP